MKKSKLLAILTTAVLTLTTVVGCGGSTTPSGGKKPEVVDLTGTTGKDATVSMSVMYNDQQTMMKFFDKNVPYASLNGTNYQQNMWKPAWAELQNRLTFKINNVTPEKATSVSNAFDLLQAVSFKNVNIMCGPVSSIVDEGTKNNTFVDLNQYREYLPDFFKFVDANEIVKKSITSDNGSIYYSPYFDGFDDIETMFICRVDWVEKLLDNATDTYSDGKTHAEKYGAVTYDKFISQSTFYEGFYDSMNTTFKTMKNATETKEVKVEYASGQGIIARQNALETKNGETLTNELKAYIKTNYIDKGYITKASELFCSQSACYNADELVALWRCVRANPRVLSGKIMDDCKDAAGDSVVIPFYPRAKTPDRANQVLQLAQLWGVRGYESRNGYFYFDKDGKLVDSRNSDDMLESLEFLHQLYKEGLICKDYSTGLTNGTEEYRDQFNKQNLGFMTYDYNQTTTIYNETINDKQSPYRNLSPIMFPVADWDNKATKATNGYSVTTDCLYQYTESWRSVKSEGWTILQSTTQNKEVFRKCLEIFNYMYTEEGQRLMTYGPDKWIEYDGDKIVTIDYYGRQVPKISTAALAELKNKDLGKGNYTNYYRYYVGSTLPIGFVKDQGMEYQAADAKGLVGLQYIGNAAKAGVLKHATVTKNTENVQNTLVPTTFALSTRQTQTVGNQCATLGVNFNNSSASGQNIFHNYVINGYAVKGKTMTKAELKSEIENAMNLKLYVSTHQDAYKKMYA